MALVGFLMKVINQPNKLEYTKTKSANKSIIIDPYIDEELNVFVISITAPIIKDGKL